MYVQNNISGRQVEINSNNNRINKALNTPWTFNVCPPHSEKELLRNTGSTLINNIIECGYVGYDVVNRTTPKSEMSFWELPEDGFRFTTEIKLNDPEEIKHITNTKYSVKYNAVKEY